MKMKKSLLAFLLCFTFIGTTLSASIVQAAEQVAASDYKQLQQLGNAKANKKALRIQERTVREDYDRRIISYHDFAQQRFNFAKQRRTFDEQEDAARLELIKSGFLPAPDDRTTRADLLGLSQERILDMRYKLEKETRELDLQIQTMENRLALGQIDASAFVAQTAELETQREINKRSLHDYRVALANLGFTPTREPKARK